MLAFSHWVVLLDDLNMLILSLYNFPPFGLPCHFRVSSPSTLIRGVYLKRVNMNNKAKQRVLNFMVEVIKYVLQPKKKLL